MPRGIAVWRVETRDSRPEGARALLVVTRLAEGMVFSVACHGPRIAAYAVLCTHQQLRDRDLAEVSPTCSRFSPLRLCSRSLESWGSLVPISLPVSMWVEGHRCHPTQIPHPSNAYNRKAEPSNLCTMPDIMIFTFPAREPTQRWRFVQISQGYPKEASGHPRESLSAEVTVDGRMADKRQVIKSTSAVPLCKAGFSASAK
ncbi:hypothetical protein P152DRAFT_228129 [Eremomyces bilateralis CBS 781.70]|uniref:Uncharacterized protein n=1 Tax=Eremomyces bilateralis CBS 781.70 TaxID=1392243 RepID=A0A6G1FRE8_9PEZI|nr:uncharacterized protein P152DRAFT_228129 [Eremomyces bilateralis CBS 781.70]KAF1808242.1 hypothetical protein P152DRAFT_228129 [Eremomyces bilateralis CBS 781.70]